MRYRSPARSSFRDVLNTSTSTNSPSKQRPPLALQQPHSRRENQAYDTMNSSSTPTTTVTPVVALGPTTVIEETKAHFHHDFPPPPSPLAKDQPDTALTTAFSIDGSIGTGTSLTTGTSAAADVSSTHALTEQQSASPTADSSHNTRAHRATASITPPAARTPSQTPVLAARDVMAGSPGGDLGYESYDSRRQLIVGQDVGQTMI